MDQIQSIPLVRPSRSVLLFTLFLHVISLPSQLTLRMDQFTSEDGLSENVVYCIHQDKQGFMWFGTDYGLNRYDGYTFRHYQSDNADSATLSNDAILCIYEEPSGKFWIGTYGGLNYFDPQSGKTERIPVDAGVTVFSISDIIALKDGILLVRSTETVAYLFDIAKRTFQALNEPRYQWARGFSFFRLPEDRFGMFYETDDKRTGIGIYHVNSRRMEFLAAQEIFPFIRLGILNYYFQDTHGYQYFSFQDQARLEVYHGNGDQVGVLDFKNPNSGFPLHTYSIEEIDTQEVWIGTNRGLVIFDRLSHSFSTPEIRTSSTASSGIKEIRDIYYGRDNNIWMGIFGDGLVKWNKEIVPFRHLTISEVTQGQTAPMIFGLLRWPGDALAVETYDGNVSIIRNDKVVAIRPKKKIAMDTLVSMSLGGRIPHFSSFQQETLQNLQQMSNHETWLYRFRLPNDTTLLCYYYGLSIYTPHSVRSFKSQLVKNIAEDNFNYWFSTPDGLWRIDKRTFMDTVYRHVPGDPYSLSETILYDVYADQNGIVWIGTKGGGLNYYDPRTRKFYHYTTEDGLPDNVVYVILPDKDGNLWLTTNKGISRFNPEDETFQNFSARDGLLNSEFNTRGGIILEDGSIYLAGTRGLDMFKPEEIGTVRPLHGVYISEWKVNNIVVPSTHFTELNYNENNIAVSVTTNEFVQPDRVYFRYRLNEDLPWMRLQGINTINFTALRSGSYHFEVEASNDNLNWTASTGRQFVIHPPWWNTWWFVALCVMTVTGMLYVFYRARISQLKRMQHMRTKISRDLHDEVGSALSSIHLFSSVASQSLTANLDKAQNALEHINSNSRRVLENMSDIVWAINTSGNERTSLERKLKNYSYELLTPLGINCVYDIDAEAERKLQHIEARKNILLITKEAMNNIAKYSRATEARVALKVNDGLLHLSVSDNGIGIDPARARNGNGIMNMQRRAEEMGGTFSLKADSSSGTALDCRVPLANISDRTTRYHL